MEERLAQKVEIPADPAQLTTGFLTQVVQTCHPGVEVAAFEIVEHKRYGETMVSTSDRLKLRLSYTGAAADLPGDVAVKMAREFEAPRLVPLYETEVNFYVRLRNGLPVEAPKAIGGLCDPEAARYYLLIDDLTKRGATFPNCCCPCAIAA